MAASGVDFQPLSSHSGMEMISLEEDESGSEGSPCIQVSELHKTYMLGVEGVAALRGVNLSVNHGEFVMILGTSGGGKTSLLNLIGTIDTPTRGSITVCGNTITERAQDNELAELRLQRIGFVFQAFNLLPSFTAVENVEVPMRLAGVLNARERRARALDLLTRVGLGDRADHTPSQLSGGEQQRVTIARSLSNNPTLLLLDEPTGDLDSRNSDLVMQILLELNQDGMAMVMVTHDVALKHHANRVINMYDGKVSNVEVINRAEREAANAQLAADCEAHVQALGMQPDEESQQQTIQVEYRSRDAYRACSAEYSGATRSPASHTMKEDSL
eukprot:TRINITY_DN18003_c0_g1_i1.p1 TRINITY_DN18003_c0_g1~~TRINITY_DN18003_c0_g1_i1.p1  ORF type:complete len:330 (-),score=64.00 TRINITY_DN18003_c0_g1_i1:182-1171(-)